MNGDLLHSIEEAFRNMNNTIFFRSLFTVFFVVAGLFAQTQEKRKIDIQKSTEGFPGKEIIETFHRIPFIKAADGFEVQERFLVMANPVPGAKKGNVWFNFEEKFSGSPLYQVTIVTNDFSFLARKSLMDAETRHFQFPDLFTDTVLLSYFNRDGMIIGQGADPHRTTDSFYLLNPKGRAFFKPVTREEYIRFLVALLQDRLNEKNKHFTQFRGGKLPDGIDPNNTKAVSLVVRNVRADSVWINYYEKRISEYNVMLAAMSNLEKQERAFAIIPKTPAIENDKQGHLKEEIQGGFQYELLVNKQDAANIIPLYEYNPTFFDPRLSPPSVQLMVFRGMNPSDKTKEFGQKMKQEFWPSLDFRAFARLMYR